MSIDSTTFSAATPVPLLDTALAYHAAGRSVVPIAPGTKIPSCFNAVTGEYRLLPSWKPFQQRPADPGLIRTWFAHSPIGIGIVCGPVSGVMRNGVQYALEVLDIDDTEALLEQFIEAANWQGLGEVLKRMVHQRTPGGAGHYAYLCSAWEGNLVLARRPGKPDDPIPAGKKDPPAFVTLIETRGEGGQAVVAPTPPGIHPDHPERGYELVHGSWTDLPTITPEERAALFTLARSFNTYVDTKHVRDPKGQPMAGTNGTRPGDLLNATADRDWWRDLLETHNWTLVYQRGDIDYWRRPGKEGKVWSATYGATGIYFYVFSSNAAPFEQGRPYSPFSALALLTHGGDFKAAAKVLAHNLRAERKSADDQGEADIPLRQRFRVDERGVYYTPPPDKEGDQLADVWVCAPLHIVAATRDVDSNNHGHLLEFSDRHGHAQQWAMPLELLEEQREYRKVLRRLGLVMNSTARDALQKYLDVCHAEARARCVDRVGWYGEAYVLPDTTLGDAGEERLVLQNLDHTSEGYRQSGTLEGWKQTIAGLCVGNTRLVLAVSTAFAAPLLHVLVEESGGLHFRGASSSGKTTAVYAAATVWGEPTRLERWRATANALEGVALAHNDNLLCLDELKEIDPREAGGVAYMLANGAGKRRGQPYGGTRPRLTWRLLFLSTGETSLEQHMAEAGQRIHAGQEVRLVDIPADAGADLGLFEQLHGHNSGQAFADHLRECTRQHYGHAGRAFVTLLAQDQGAHRAQVRKSMVAFVERNVPPEATGQVARVAQRFALIAAAGELATAGGLTGWPEGEAFTAAQRCFREWLGHRGGVGNADDVRALAQVRLYFEQYGASRFVPWTLDDGVTCQRCSGTGKVGYSYLQGVCFTCHGAGKITAEHPAMRLVHARAGWARATDDGRTEFFVLPEVFRKEVVQGFEAKWIARLLGAHGYLLASSQGKWLRSERIPGLGRTSVYRVTAELLGSAVLQEQNNDDESGKQN